jgi:hypothetical protein
VGLSSLFISYFFGKILFKSVSPPFVDATGTASGSITLVPFLWLRFFVVMMWVRVLAMVVVVIVVVVMIVVVVLMVAVVEVVLVVVVAVVIVVVVVEVVANCYW